MRTDMIPKAGIVGTLLLGVVLALGYYTGVIPRTLLWFMHKVAEGVEDAARPIP